MIDRSLLSVVSVDVIPISLHPNGLRIGGTIRKDEPEAGKLCLPGVVMQTGERITDAALRALSKLPVSAKRAVLRQGRMFDEPHRDPRGPSLSVSVLAAFPPSAQFSCHFPAELDVELGFDHAQIIRETMPDAGRLLWRDAEFTKALTGDRFSTSDALQIAQGLSRGSAPHRGNLNRSIEASGAVKDGLASSYGHRPAIMWAWR